MNLITVDTPWSRAVVSPFGAQVLSFEPKDGTDLLWHSPAPLPLPAAIRGGVPLCWPWFARQNVPATAVQHGPARVSDWVLASRVVNADDESVLTWQPARPLDAMAVTLTVIVGRVLVMQLRTFNGDSQPRVLTQAFHNYLAVQDAAQALLPGLNGMAYLDSREGGAPRVQQGDIDPPVALDRIYHGFDHNPSITLLDRAGRRKITVATGGCRSVVVWNPGAELAASMKDVPGDSWRHFVCVEAANAGPDRRELAPGASHVLAQTLSVQPL